MKLKSIGANSSQAGWRLEGGHNRDIRRDLSGRLARDNGNSSAFLFPSFGMAVSERETTPPAVTIRRSLEPDFFPRTSRQQRAENRIENPIFTDVAENK
jgi:hypothetical protein